VGKPHNRDKDSMTHASDLYAQFEKARCQAMTLTDRFRELAPNDPRRRGLWDRAMEQTEQARQLLEIWLHSEEPASYAPVRDLVLT
jgi:hypothetical protein